MHFITISYFTTLGTPSMISTLVKHHGTVRSAVLLMPWYMHTENGTTPLENILQPGVAKDYIDICMLLESH